MSDIFNNFAGPKATDDAKIETATKTKTKGQKTKTPKTPKNSKQPLPDKKAEEAHDMKWAVKQIRSDKFKLDLLDRIMWSSKQRKVYAFLLDKKERIYALVMFTNMVTPSLIVHELCQKIELDFDSKSESSILKTHVRHMGMTLRKTSMMGHDIIICQVDE